MKKLKLLFFILIMLTLYDGYSQSKKTSLTLTIEVASFENTKGVLRVCITDKKDDFLKSCIFSKTVVVKDATVSLKIENMEKGDWYYASKKFAEAELIMPNLDHASKSLLMASFCLYQINFYPEAEASLKRFVSKYPADKNIEYAKCKLKTISISIEVGITSFLR